MKTNDFLQFYNYREFNVETKLKLSCYDQNCRIYLKNVQQLHLHRPNTFKNTRECIFPSSTKNFFFFNIKIYLETNFFSFRNFFFPSKNCLKASNAFQTDYQMFFVGIPKLKSAQLRLYYIYTNSNTHTHTHAPNYLFSPTLTAS